MRQRVERETQLLAERVMLAQQTKEERAEIERLIAEARVLHRRKALEQKESVRRAQLEAEARMQQLRASKLHVVSGRAAQCLDCSQQYKYLDVLSTVCLA